MNKIKRFLFVPIVIFAAVVFVACGKKDNTTDTVNYAFEGKTVTYDGNPHSLEVTGTLPSGVTVQYSINNGAVSVGVYPITATLTGEGFTTKTLSATLTIEAAAWTLPDGVRFNDASFVVDGQTHSLEVTGTLPAGVNVTYSNNNGQRNVGEYTVSAVFSRPNYKDITLTAKLTITGTDDGQGEGNDEGEGQGEQGGQAFDAVLEYGGSPLWGVDVVDANYGTFDNSPTAKLYYLRAVFDFTNISSNSHIIAPSGSTYYYLKPIGFSGAVEINNDGNWVPFDSNMGGVNYGVKMLSGEVGEYDYHTPEMGIISGRAPGSTTRITLFYTYSINIGTPFDDFDDDTYNIRWDYTIALDSSTAETKTICTLTLDGPTYNNTENQSGD
jgi:hypothetical protein